MMIISSLIHPLKPYKNLPPSRIELNKVTQYFKYKNRTTEHKSGKTWLLTCGIEKSIALNYKVYLEVFLYCSHVHLVFQKLLTISID